MINIQPAGIGEPTKTRLQIKLIRKATHNKPAVPGEGRKWRRRKAEVLSKQRCQNRLNQTAPRGVTAFPSTWWSLSLVHNVCLGPASKPQKHLYRREELVSMKSFWKLSTYLTSFHHRTIQLMSPTGAKWSWEASTNWSLSLSLSLPPISPQDVEVQDRERKELGVGVGVGRDKQLRSTAHYISYF